MASKTTAVRLWFRDLREAVRASEDFCRFVEGSWSRCGVEDSPCGVVARGIRMGLQYIRLGYSNLVSYPFLANCSRSMCHLQRTNYSGAVELNLEQALTIVNE